MQKDHFLLCRRRFYEEDFACVLQVFCISFSADVYLICSNLIGHYVGATE